MSSLRIGLGQSNLKASRFDRCGGRWSRGRTVNLAQGCARLPRPLNAAADDLALDRSTLDRDVALRQRSLDKEDVVSGKVDQWVRDSVQEIVSNIEEAPFLVHIYPGDGLGSGGGSKTKMVREKAAENRWPNIKQGWERGNSIPNGIALVEELNIGDEDVLPNPEEKTGIVGSDNQHCSSTKVFGIVIQERGLTCPACYILKTSIVRSITGTCTHYCIFRAECFGEAADVQLKRQWLL